MTSSDRKKKNNFEISGNQEISEFVLYFKVNVDGFVRSIFTAGGFFQHRQNEKNKFRLNLIAVDKSFCVAGFASKWNACYGKTIEVFFVILDIAIIEGNAVYM